MMGTARHGTAQDGKSWDRLGDVCATSYDYLSDSQTVCQLRSADVSQTADKLSGPTGPTKRKISLDEVEMHKTGD